MDESQNRSDRVAKLCYEKFERLPKTGKPARASEWTLLAAIVAEDTDQKTFRVLSLATGTKSIPTSDACKLGNRVIDSHAEVLARRAFLRHVYSELRKLAQKKTSPTFVLADDPTAKPTADGPGAGVSGAEPQLKSFRCKLRNSLKLHLFTSHTPCGDASIFPKDHESQERLDDNNEVPSKRLKLGADDIHRYDLWLAY